MARGLEAAAMFDGCPDTFYDGESVYFQDLYDGPRIDGGCLRVDLGKIYPVSRVEIEFFKIDEPIFEVQQPHIGEEGTFRSDLLNWRKAPLQEAPVTEENVKAPVVKYNVETLFYSDGVKKTAVYLLYARDRCDQGERDGYLCFA